MTIEYAVLAAEEMPSNWYAGDWSHSTAALAPSRLQTRHHDSRWDVRYATALAGKQVLAALTIARPLLPRVPDHRYDLREHFGDSVGNDARGWVILGGHTDLAAGIPVTPWLSTPQASQIRLRLVAEALRCRTNATTATAALYVREPEAASFPSPARTIHLGDDAAIRMNAASMDELLSRLRQKQRVGIRRDQRQFTELGLQSHITPVEEVWEEAAELVASVKRRHGIADHPRLALLRLQQWREANCGRYFACSITHPEHGLAAASFACHNGEVLEVHEVGLRDIPQTRLPSYLESCLYAPMRYAVANKCERIELGTEAIATKKARGAQTTPVWAMLLN